MILNRHWYERFEGRGEYDDYVAAFARLSSAERAELIAFVSERNPSMYARELGQLPSNIQRVVRFYFPITKEVEAKIRLTSRALRHKPHPEVRLTEEEIVEDAGLEDESFGIEIAALPILQRAS